MKFLDMEPWAWMLFEHQGDLYLDANCCMSAFGYTYMIKLNQEELAKYQREGRKYLDWLAHDIHYTVPISRESTSIYRDRRVSKEIQTLAMEAAKKHRESNSAD